MKQIFAILLLSILLLSPFSAAHARGNAGNLNDPSFQRAVLDTLSVQADGTLSIDTQRAKGLLGSSFDAAIADLANVNDAIKAGNMPKFHSTDELYSYKIIGGTPSGEAQVIKASASAVPSYCRGGTCIGHMCCCSGWWIFCWGYCQC